MKSSTRNAKLKYPSGFRFRASLKLPIKMLPMDLVVPQNGQGNPVIFLNIHRDGPTVNPDERIAKALAAKRIARSVKTRMGNLTRCNLAISNFEIKNWAVRFITNLTAQLRFLVA
jgi:hypothetical protein